MTRRKNRARSREDKVNKRRNSAALMGVSMFAAVAAAPLSAPFADGQEAAQCKGGRITDVFVALQR
jgi:hypothetical protein